ncbi:MAG: sel1 repeat family protein [Robiginitomaculum sp.]|nr:sel1 repeat family protein [Robiginitomaculum sp.]
MVLVFVLSIGLVTPASGQVLDTKKSARATTVSSSSLEAKRLFLQAKAFHDGINVTKDLRKARFIYLKSAGLGNNDARINLGYLYFVGEGVEQNYTKAHNWYLSAARTGNKDAQMNLALMYENGLGVKKDLEKAAYWRKYGTRTKRKTTAEIKVGNTKPGLKNSVKPDPAAISLPAPNPMAKASVDPAARPENAEIIDRNEESLALQIQGQKLPKPFALTRLGIKLPASLVRVPPRLRSSQNLVIQVNTNRGVIPSQTFQLPVWTGNTLIVVLLFLSVFGSIWFARQYGNLLEAARGHAFKEAFYAHHRESLRTNFLKYPQRQSFHSRIDDPWALAMSVLMVRFAQVNAKTATRIGEQSRKILGAYKLSPMDARKSVFKFVSNIQERIVSDIYALDCVQKNTAKPIQYSQKIKARNIVKLHSGHRKKDQEFRAELLPVEPSAE